MNNKLDSIKLLKSKINFEDGFWDKGITTYLNPFSYLFFRDNKSMFEKFDNICIDGQLLVVLLNLFVFTKYNKVKRCSFDMTSIAPLVFQDCLDHNKSIFFVGSTQENIIGFISQIRNKYSGIDILGFRNGYFKTEKDKDLFVNEIIALNPNYVIIGMGSPYQESFLLKLSSAGFKGVGHTCGGFIHQTSKSTKYYPLWVDKLHLRWAFRIWDEPSLFSRYFFKYPISFFLFLKDVLRTY